MTRLSVNVNKIATLRNARGGNMPNLTNVVSDCERFGAQGITIHPRPDERHIRYSDVFDLKKVIHTELNIEGYPSKKFIQLVKEILPTQVTLVPDPPDALTSNAGWDTLKHISFLQDVVSEFQESGIRTSIFVDTAIKNIEGAKAIHTNRVELYTEAYAMFYTSKMYRAVAPFKKAAQYAIKLGLEVNAGHDLSLDNLAFFHQNIPEVSEVSIGHALISDALYFGLESTIKKYLKCLK